MPALQHPSRPYATGCTATYFLFSGGHVMAHRRRGKEKLSRIQEQIDCRSHTGSITHTRQHTFTASLPRPIQLRGVHRRQPCLSLLNAWRTTAPRKALPISSDKPSQVPHPTASLGPGLRFCWRSDCTFQPGHGSMTANYARGLLSQNDPGRRVAAGGVLLCNGAGLGRSDRRRPANARHRGHSAPLLHRIPCRRGRSIRSQLHGLWPP
jgi:hypothetical protein